MVSRIYEYNRGLIGENLPENYKFCIFDGGYFDEIIDAENPSTEPSFEKLIGTVLVIYQTDLSLDDLRSIRHEEVLEEEIPNHINEYYPNNEWIYIGQIIISDDGGNEIILNGNANEVSLVINNKIVSNIKNNSNNKIIDSISMDGNIIYQRNEDNV